MPDPKTIESILSQRTTQVVLRFLTKKDRRGRCLLDKVFAKYGRSDTSTADRIRYAVPFFLIDYVRKKVGGTREGVIKRVCEHRPTARALVNTARGVGTYGLLKPQVFSAPLMVVWNFTQACNFKCKHCYQDARRRLEDELALDEQLRIVDELADCDVPFLAFSGGEPLMSKNFWPAAEHAREREMHLTVATNGSLVTPDVAKRLADLKFGYVEISIDSTDPKKHDAFRGAPGYWKKAVTGIRNAVAQGLKVGFSATITRMNFDELEGLIALAKDLGCQNFYAFNFIPTGRGKDIVDMDITPQMREEMLRILHKHLLSGEIAIMCTASQFGRACMQLSDADGLVNTGHYGAAAGAKTRILAKYVGGCGAGRCYLAIQPNGIVTPCVFMPLPVGDLRKQSLMDIWENSAVFKLLRDRTDRTGHCKVCKYRYHCGGCRARSYGYYRDLRAPDPGCINNLKDWKELTQRVEAVEAAAE
ncbi:MAG: radical SAM protein [Planctomycetes bacterium]|nr:radical SAM protein [Planctomycetota bacterium]